MPMHIVPREHEHMSTKSPALILKVHANYTSQSQTAVNDFKTKYLCKIMHEYITVNLI